MSSRSSSSVSKPASAARSSSSAGSSLALTSLTETANCASLPGQLAAPVVVGEGHGDRALLAGGGALELLLEAGHEPAGAELDHLVAPLAAARTARRRACPCNPSPRSRRCRPARSTVSSRAERSRRRSSSAPIASSDDVHLALADLERPCSRRARPSAARRSRSRSAAARPGAAGRRGRAPARRPARSAPRRRRPCTRRRSTRVRPRRARRRGPCAGRSPARGALPARKPGTRRPRPSRLAACSTRRSTSAAGTSASTRTRDSGSSVTVVTTSVAIGGPPRYKAGRDTPIRAWLYTGPLGHLAAGVADWVQLLARRV